MRDGVAIETLAFAPDIDPSVHSESGRELGRIGDLGSRFALEYPDRERVGCR
jgi:hypothetical protein